MTSTASLGTSALLAWGAIGGVILYLSVVLLPKVNEALEQGGKWPNRRQWTAIVILGGLYIFFGAFAAWYHGNISTSREALTYGLGWPVLFKSLGEGLKALGKVADSGDGSDA